MAKNKVGGGKVICICLIVLVLIYAIFQIEAILSMRKTILDLPNYEEYIKVDGRTMKFGDSLFEIASKEQLNIIQHYLLNESVMTLILIIYVLYGLVGGFLFFILLAFNPRIVGIKPREIPKELKISRVALRLFLSGLIGVVFYLLLKLPQPILKSLIPAITSIDKGKGNSTEIYESLKVIPLLAGILMVPFYQKILYFINKFFQSNEEDIDEG